jgi:hypothetical protein
MGNWLLAFWFWWVCGLDDKDASEDKYPTAHTIPNTTNDWVNTDVLEVRLEFREEDEIKAAASLLTVALLFLLISGMVIAFAESVVLWGAFSEGRE